MKKEPKWKIAIETIRVSNEQSESSNTIPQHIYVWNL